MAGPRDEAHLIRESADGNLTADVTYTFTVTGGTPHPHGLQVKVLLPQDLAETSDTLKVTLKSTDTLHKAEFTHTDLVTKGTGTYPRLLTLPLWPSKSEGWSLVFDATDADAGGDFNAGAVQAWLELVDESAKVDNTS